VARGEAVVLELPAEVFRRLGADSPQAIEQVGVLAITRRAELDRARSSARDSVIAETPASFLADEAFPASLPELTSLFRRAAGPYR
jgi:hypothetical protein